MRALFILLALTPLAHAFQIPASSSQLILGIADTWDSSHTTLRFYERSKGKWQTVGPAIPARLGRSGMAWGLGLHPLPKDATMKKEGDGRAPAGVFALGGAWGYAKDIQRHPKLPYKQVSPHDLWVEDPAHSFYNHHVVLPHAPKTPWEKKQQMKQTDPAHALKLFIKHNAPPGVAQGMGSSIFFHIWRADGAKPTAGCTTMAAPQLQQLIARIDPTQNPLYVLLPRTEYERVGKSWKLP